MKLSVSVPFFFKFMFIISNAFPSSVYSKKIDANGKSFDKFHMIFNFENIKKNCKNLVL